MRRLRRWPERWLALRLALRLALGLRLGLAPCLYLGRCHDSRVLDTHACWGGAHTCDCASRHHHQVASGQAEQNIRQPDATKPGDGGGGGTDHREQIPNTHDTARLPVRSGCATCRRNARRNVRTRLFSRTDSPHMSHHQCLRLTWSPPSCQGRCPPPQVPATRKEQVW